MKAFRRRKPTDAEHGSASSSSDDERPTRYRLDEYRPDAQQRPADPAMNQQAEENAPAAGVVEASTGSTALESTADAPAERAEEGSGEAVSADRAPAATLADTSSAAPSPAAPLKPDQPTPPVDTRRRVDDHLATVLNGIGVLEPIELTILDAQGLTLAEDVSTRRALPGFDNSAMDGYAVRAVDVASASQDTPAVLPVVGDIVAGARSVSGMGPGLAMRIMTGAPMPAGADAVVRLEDTDRGLANVGVRVAVRSGQSVRRAGEDMPAGRLALGSGASLGPQQIGLLAAIGRERVLIRPRPRVIVISTGDELVDIGSEPAFGQLPDSNSYLLTAAAREAGAEAYRVGIVADDHTKLMELLESQLLRADVIVTSGGVSMGAYDVVKQTLGELGTVEFTQVAMQPGKPQGFGHIGPDFTPIFCLPGNPVSALVSFETFVRPAIRKLLGKRRLHRASVPAVALDRIPGSIGTRQYRRGLLHREADGRYSVSTVGGSGSHLIAALAASNCLIVVDEDVAEVVPGSQVSVLPLLLSQR